MHLATYKVIFILLIFFLFYYFLIKIVNWTNYVSPNSNKMTWNILKHVKISSWKISFNAPLTSVSECSKAIWGQKDENHEYFFSKLIHDCAGFGSRQILHVRLWTDSVLSAWSCACSHLPSIWKMLNSLKIDLGS